MSTETLTIPIEIRTQLNEPLPLEAVSQHPTKPYMSSIKTIYMVERLNLVFGENGWLDEYEVIENRPESKMIVVFGKLTIAKFGIVRRAFGGNDNSDRGDAYKGACTDSLSKMCSMIGIGMHVYKGSSDHPEAGTPEANKQKRAAQREVKRQYEAIEGVVTEYTRMDSGTVWLIVRGIRCMTNDALLVKKLGDCQGKLVHLNAFWATAGKDKTPCMKITAVHGVYEPTPKGIDEPSLQINDADIHAAQKRLEEERKKRVKPEGLSLAFGSKV